MIVASERLGSVEIDEQDILHFPEGVLGFGALTRFVLVSPEGAGDSVRVLQAVDEPAVSFIVTDPKAIRPGYAPKLQAQDWTALGLDGPVEAEALDVWAILTVYDDPADMTVNLLAPVVIHRPSKVGRQVIQTESGYSVRHHVLAELARTRPVEIETVETAEAAEAVEERVGAAQEGS